MRPLSRTFRASQRHVKLRRPPSRTTTPARLGGRVSRAAFRISHMRASFTVGTINVTYDLWMILTAVSGIFCLLLYREMESLGSRLVLISQVAYNSRDNSQVHGPRAVGSLHGITSSPLRSISFNGRTRFIPLDESLSFSFRKKLLNRRTMLTVSVAFRAREWARTRNVQQLVFSLLFNGFLSSSTSVRSFLGM